MLWISLLGIIDPHRRMHIEQELPNLEFFGFRIGNGSLACRVARLRSRLCKNERLARLDQALAWRHESRGSDSASVQRRLNCDKLRNSRQPRRVDILSGACVAITGMRQALQICLRPFSAGEDCAPVPVGPSVAGYASDIVFSHRRRPPSPG